MKLINRLVAFVLSLVLLFPMTDTVLASSVHSTQYTDYDSLLQIMEKYGSENFTVTPLSKTADLENMLQFDTMEEFEAFLESLNSMEPIVLTGEIPEFEDFTSSPTRAAWIRGNSETELRHSVAVPGSYFINMRVIVSYGYEYLYPTHVGSQRTFTHWNSTASGLTGLTVITGYEQTSAPNPNFSSDKKTMYGNIYGVWIYGVAVAGLNIGYRHPMSFRYEIYAPQV